MKKKLPKPSEIAEKAICLLEKVGWHQGSLIRRSRVNPEEVGSMCLLGSIYVAAHGSLKAKGVTELPGPAIDLRLVRQTVFDTMQEMVCRKSNSLNSVAGFNDSSGTKKEDAVNFMKAVKKTLQARGK